MRRARPNRAFTARSADILYLVSRLTRSVLQSLVWCAALCWALGPSAGSARCRADEPPSSDGRDRAERAAAEVAEAADRAVAAEAAGRAAAAAGEVEAAAVEAAAVEAVAVEAAGNDAAGGDVGDVAPPLAAVPAVQVFQAVQQAAVVAPEEVQWNYFSDGVMYYSVNGRVQQQRADALEQVAASFPAIRLARAMPGDTLAKLAAQHQVPVERLALLNRKRPDEQFGEVGVVCLEWKYVLPEGRTLGQLANMVGSSLDTLRQLNELAPDEVPPAGRELLIPGQLIYHHQGSGGHLQLAMYDVNRIQPNVPYKPDSIRMRQESIDDGQSLADFAKEHDLAEDLLRTMNGMRPDEDIPAGTNLVIEYSAEPTETATVAAIVAAFQLDRERFFAANNWATEDDVDLTQRINIPIGERMRSQVNRAQAEAIREPVEVQLGSIGR
jgi:LysM repeat protein